MSQNLFWIAVEFRAEKQIGRKRKLTSNRKSRIKNRKCAYRRPPIIRSTDAGPPPAIKSANAIPSIATASSIPAGAKKAGQRTPVIATSITQAIRNAPTRVNSPSSTRIPPMSSDNAAAPIHNHAGRMNGKGAGKDVNFANPGPLNEPSTFWEPCPMKAIPRASRSGTVTHEEEVEVSFRSMDLPFRKLQIVWNAFNYKSVFVCFLAEKFVACLNNRLACLEAGYCPPTVSTAQAGGSPPLNGCLLLPSGFVVTSARSISIQLAESSYASLVFFSNRLPTDRSRPVW
jgi:hypothetical protein